MPSTTSEIRATRRVLGTRAPIIALALATVIVAAAAGTAEAQWLPLGPVFQSPQFYDAGEGSQTIACGDLNGDGHTDLVIVNTSSEDVSVLLGTGTGGFGPESRFALHPGSGPTSVALGRINNGPDLDVVVTNEGTGDVSVLLGNGIGGFGAPTRHATGLGATAVAIGDLDGDERADLVVANLFAVEDNITLMFGDGFGLFTLDSLTAGGGPDAVEIADLDHDGIPDLVVGNRQDDDITVFMGTGEGAFEAGVDFAAGGDPFDLAIADFDYDGRLDVACANFVAMNVSVLFGDGAGAFPVRHVYPLGINETPGGIAVADLNNDKYLDLITADFFSGRMCVLRGSVKGGFFPPEFFPFGDFVAPSDVCVADFDHDGWLDVAATEFLLGDAVAFINRIHVAARPEDEAFGRGGRRGAPGLTGNAWDAPDALRLSAAPNPLNPSTVVRFSAVDGGEASVTVHDLTGRLVRTLYSGSTSNGVREVAWDGTDEGGRRVASGVYLLRLAAAGRQEVVRITVLR
jgi:hypothetical protein